MNRVRLLLMVTVVAILGGGVYLGVPNQGAASPELPPAGDGPYLICPGPLAGGGFASRLGVYSDDPAPGRATIVGVPDAEAPLEFAGLGGALLNVGELAELGTTPLYVEAAGTIAAATFSGTADSSAITSCVRGESGAIALVGLSTFGNEASEIHLVNPFTQDSTVRMEIVSELGTDTPSDLEAVRVPAGTHIELPLTRVLSGREAISVRLDATTGLIAASAVRRGESDLSVVGAYPGGLEWHFPIFGAALTGELHLRATAELIGDYRIDRLDQTGSVEGVAEGILNPGQQVIIPVADLTDQRGGLTVVATEPLVAGLVVDAGTTRSAIPGGTLGSRWVVPVSAAGQEGQTLVWVVNTSGGVATLAITPLDGSSEVIAVEIPSGALAEVPLPNLDGGGVLIEADELIVVAFGVVQGDAIGMAMASVLG